MDLKDEYNKRIEIIRTKQSLRKKKNIILFKEQNGKIINIKDKIQNLKLELENVINQKEIITDNLNKNIISNKKLPSSVIYINDNYENKIKLLKDDYDIKNKLLGKEKINFENDIKQKKNKILEQFNEQNLPLINKKEKYKKEISKNLDDLEYNKRLLRFEIKTQSTSLGDRFKNRKHNISILEQRTDIIKNFRKQQEELYNKIKTQELEYNKFNNDVDFDNKKNLSYLNSYINNERLLIKSEINLENKKKHFENIKKKNNDYKKMINKQKQQRKEIKTKLQNLNNELNNSTNLPKLEILKKKEVNKSNIDKIKKKIGDLNYKLTSNQIENQSNNILLETNQAKINTKLSELEIILEQKIDIYNKKKYNNNFQKEYDNLLLKQANEINQNNKLLYDFLNQTIYHLFQKKRTQENIKINKIDLGDSEKIILNNQGKIKNNEYILDKIEIKFEIEKFEREEEDNLLSIEELIEIQELNQKLLSISE
jgi:hypothetical protein